ncbi:MAG: chromate resistance protein [Clostridiales bacterium]|nr:chromate resistance protein [Clostridiales bacterium]
MKWVTRSRVHVDRVACPWLIKRFVDTNAEIIFVARNLVPEIAEKEGAIPFDTGPVELGHKDGHCTFVTIMNAYNLGGDSALKMLSEVVDAADTNRLDENPYAHGLEAIAVGFGMVFPDDYENLEYQFLVYDALYNFFKLQAAKK